MSIVEIVGGIVRHPLNRGRGARALLRFLRWQVGARLAPGEVLYHWIGDTVAVVAPGERGFTGNIYCGLYELPEMAYVLHVAGPADVFVDVGANVGAYTLLACGVRGASGHCFEPVPATYQRLLRNLRVNDLLGRVTAHNVGVGERVGQLRLTSGSDCENHVVGSAESATDAISVPVTTLDDALREQPATFLKVDVEGFETAVLAGATSVLANPALHSVIMELNGSGARYGYDERALVRKMEKNGFLPHEYDAFTRTLRRASGDAGWTGNVLFVRDVARVQARVSSAPSTVINGVTL